MNISEFSKRCVFIPPVKSDRVLSQTEQEELKQVLEKEFTRLRDSGVEVALCLGGMNLDYERYDVSHIIPCVMVYHTTFQYFEEIPQFYESTIEEIQSELDYVEQKFSFLEAIILNDEYNSKVASLDQSARYLLDIGQLEIEVEPKLLHKYVGKQLLFNWLAEQKILVAFNNQKQISDLKKRFDRNKVGLKMDITLNGTKFYVCNNPIREDILFR